jgi:hypothetical protein
MEEQEINTERLHEIVEERRRTPSWAERVALTTALLAVCAAITGLFATSYSDHAILAKVEASDRWAYYQAKGIKSMLTPDPAERARYNTQQETIQKEALKLDRDGEVAITKHEFFAYSVTTFQVATAIGAIASSCAKSISG